MAENSGKKPPPPSPGTAMSNFGNNKVGPANVGDEAGSNDTLVSSTSVCNDDTPVARQSTTAIARKISVQGQHQAHQKALEDDAIGNTDEADEDIWASWEQSWDKAMQDFEDYKKENAIPTGDKIHDDKIQLEIKALEKEIKIEQQIRTLMYLIRNPCAEKDDASLCTCGGRMARNREHEKRRLARKNGKQGFWRRIAKLAGGSGGGGGSGDDDDDGNDVEIDDDDDDDDESKNKLKTLEDLLKQPLYDPNEGSCSKDQKEADRLLLQERLRVKPTTAAGFREQDRIRSALVYRSYAYREEKEGSSEDIAKTILGTKGSVTGRTSHELPQFVWDELERLLDKNSRKVEVREVSVKRKAVSAKVKADEYDGWTKSPEETLAMWKRRNPNNRTARVYEAKYLRKNIYLNPAMYYFEKMGSFKAFPKAVQVEVICRDLYEIGTDRFTCKIDVCARWWDPAYDTPAWMQAAKDGLKKAEVTSYCMPHLTVRDAMEDTFLPEFDDKEHIGTVDLLLGDAPKYGKCGIVEKRVTTLLTIRDDNDIRAFPFDRQDLTIEIDMPLAGDLSDADYGRYLVPFTAANQSVHDQPLWAYHPMVAHVVAPPRSKQRLVCTIRASRVPWMYLYKVALIVFLTTMLAWGVYLVPIDAVGDRAGITLTLLLTAVAFQLVLQDDGGMPKVPYLTHLDKYVLASFIVIFVIVIFTNISALLVGIENTAFCGGKCANRTSHFGESLSLKVIWRWSGQNTYNETIGFELWSQFGLMLVWILINIMFVGGGLYETWNQYRYFGKKFQQQGWFMSDNGDKQVTLKRIMKDEANFGRKERLFVKRCKTNKHAKKQYRKAQFENKDKVDQPKQHVVNTDPVQMRMIKGTLLNAGETLVYSSLGKVFHDQNLSLETMRDIDETMTWKILQTLQLKDRQSASIMKTVKNQVDVIYLQGSASYLMMELEDHEGVKMEGRLVYKPELIEAVEDLILQATMTGPQKIVHRAKKTKEALSSLNTKLDLKVIDEGQHIVMQKLIKQSWKKDVSRVAAVSPAAKKYAATILDDDGSYSIAKAAAPAALGESDDGTDLRHAKQAEDEAADQETGLDFQLFANCLLCRTLMYSSASPGLSFYSSRECRGQQATIHTQLWYGYARTLAEDFMTSTKEASTKEASTKEYSGGFRSVVVDLGSGETKRLYSIKKDQHTALAQEGDPIKGGNAKLQDTMQELIDACVDAVKDKKTDAADNRKDEIAKHFIASCFENPDKVEVPFQKAPSPTPSTWTPGVDVVRVFGTGSVRKLFASNKSRGKPVREKIMAVAKMDLLNHLSKALENYVEENKILRVGTPVTAETVSFVIMAQTDEAKYEFAAAEEALNHAIDLPLDIQRGNASAGNLAWGNGSMQGYPEGRGKKGVRALTLNAGLKNVQDALCDAFVSKGAAGFHDFAKQREKAQALWDTHKDEDELNCKKQPGDDSEDKLSKPRFFTVMQEKKGKMKPSKPRIKISVDNLAKAYEAVRGIVEKESGTTPIALFKTPDMMQEDDDLDDVEFKKARAGSTQLHIENLKNRNSLVFESSEEPTGQYGDDEVVAQRGASIGVNKTNDEDSTTLTTRQSASPTTMQSAQMTIDGATSVDSNV